MKRFFRRKTQQRLEDLSQQELFYLQLANDAYRPLKDRKTEYLLNGTRYRNSGIFSDRTTLVLWNSLTRHLIISYRGTASFSDVITDTYYAFSRENKTFRFKKDLEKFKRIVDYYKPRKITVIGHSLGGGIALYMNENNKVDDVYIVNPAFNLRNLKRANLKGDYSNTTIYRTAKDPVSYASVLSNVTTKIIPQQVGKNLLDSHRSSNFIIKN